MSELEPWQKAQLDQDMEAVIADMVEKGWITITYENGERILNMTEEGFVAWAEMEKEEKEKGL